MHQRNKKMYLFLGGFFVAAILLLILATVSKLKNVSSSRPLPTPTPINSKPQLPSFYQPNKTQQMLQTIEHRPQLNQTDTSIKDTLTNMIQDANGTIYSTKDFTVFYVRAANLFQVEIDGSDIDKVKAEANSWFLSKGLSQSGICNLPVSFYLTYPVLQTVKQKGVQFNPLPNNC